MTIDTLKETIAGVREDLRTAPGFARAGLRKELKAWETSLLRKEISTRRASRAALYARAEKGIRYMEIRGLL